MRHVMAAAAMAAVVGGGLAVVGLGAAGPSRGGTAAAAPGPAAADPAAPGSGRARPPRLEAALAHLTEEVRPGADGGLVIGNPAYRAAFSATGGVVFTPRIEGREEPRLRWQYRARAIDAGGVTRPLAPVAPRVSPTGAHVVDFARPGLIERYEGERRGVEQIFVLTERPAGAGDVRIRGEVTFAGTARAADGGVTFAAEGLPPFTYAAPIAFDATGARLPVRTELQGAELQLVVDGPALARATLPVTIDPLFGVTTVDEAGVFWGLGVAYGVDRDEFLVAYPSAGGATGIEIRVRRYGSMGDPIGPPLAVATGDMCVRPAVAYDQHTRRYLVAWLRVDDALPEVIALRGQVLDAIGQPLGPEIALAPGETADFAVAPTVVARNHRQHGVAEVGFGVSFRSLSNSAGSLVRVVRVRGDGGLAGASIIAPGTYPGLAYDPLFDRFLVAYKSGEAFFAKTLTAGGVVAGAATTIGASPCAQQNVSVAFDAASRRYLAIYAASNAGTCDLRGALLGPTATPAVLGAITVEAGSATASHHTHGVAAEAGTFLVGYVTDVRENGTTTYSVRSRRVRADGLLLAQADWGLADQDATNVPVAAGVHGSTPLAWLGELNQETGWPIRMAMGERWFSRSVHAHGDLDGDGRSDLFTYQPFTDLLIARTQSTTTNMVFAVPGGFPALLDWDGDGRTDRCVWEPGTGKWWLFESSTSNGYTITLGEAGDIPVPGDYLGLGRDQIAVFRPSNGTWYIRASAFARPVTLAFGQVGDLPVPADWNGDGDVEPGIWRPSTGVWSAVQPDGTPVSMPAAAWGQAGDVPLAGNFVGDATADQVVYRRQLGVAWIRDGATSSTSTHQIGDGLPMPLDWDGDGALNLTLMDPESFVWHIRVGSQTVDVTFGTVGDIPAGR